MEPLEASDAACSGEGRSGPSLPVLGLCLLVESSGPDLLLSADGLRALSPSVSSLTHSGSAFDDSGDCHSSIGSSVFKGFA